MPVAALLIHLPVVCRCRGAARPREAFHGPGQGLKPQPHGAPPDCWIQCQKFCPPANAVPTSLARPSWPGLLQSSVSAACASLTLQCQKDLDLKQKGVPVELASAPGLQAGNEGVWYGTGQHYVPIYRQRKAKPLPAEDAAGRLQSA